jgi:phosphoribosylaminoimidazole-succinocarboxamide synthase
MLCKRGHGLDNLHDVTFPVKFWWIVSVIFHHVVCVIPTLKPIKGASMTAIGDVTAAKSATNRTEGKTKILTPGTIPEEWLVTFKDDATAFNGKKHATIAGKGALNARISALLFQRLQSAGIPTCFIRAGESDNTLIYKHLTMIPLEVVVRNAAYGSIVKRFDLPEGQTFSQPLIEFFYKSADDPLITDALILELKLVKDSSVLERIRRMALAINAVFVPLFASCGIRCADFKLEFGLDADGNLVLGDELSPDNFRLRDSQTGDVLDKDVFRLDLADLAQTYQTLLQRLEQQATQAPSTTQSAISAPQVSTLYPVEICVQSRQAILNPESRTIQETLHALGHTGVEQLRAGKRFTLALRADNRDEAEQLAHRLAKDVLSNPVIEDYTLRIADGGETLGSADA